MVQCNKKNIWSQRPIVHSAIHRKLFNYYFLIYKMGIIVFIYTKVF
jgi:hypothetical protein